MKYLSVLGLLFIGNFNVMGQYLHRLDQANMFENRYALEFACSEIQFIEEGEVDLVREFFLPEFTPDSSIFNLNVQEVASKFFFEVDSYPLAFYKKDEESTWYSRTYYKIEGAQVEYLYQIYVQSAEIDGLLKVTNIQFRKADEITKLDKAIKGIMERVIESVNAPKDLIVPPPGPPAVCH